MLIGDRLRAWRKENKLSAQKVADKTNVSQSIISYYELNKSPMPSDFLLALHEAYQIDLIWLLTGKQRDSSEFTEEEIELIEKFRKCTKEGKELIKINANALSSKVEESGSTSELSTSKTG